MSLLTVGGSWQCVQTLSTVWQPNYSLLETYHTLRVLVEQFSFTGAHPALQKAADYTFSCQRAGGDIRDIIGNQLLTWFVHHQEDGLWPTGYSSGRKAADNRRWVGLAICRLLKHYSGDD